jgi:hypothetical protein
MIRVFDAYGREMFISKETWRTTALWALQSECLYVPSMSTKR